MQVLAAEVGEGKASEVVDALLLRRPNLAQQLHGRPSQVACKLLRLSNPSTACEPPAVTGPHICCCTFSGYIAFQPASVLGWIWGQTLTGMAA